MKVPPELGVLHGDTGLNGDFHLCAPEATGVGKEQEEKADLELEKSPAARANIRDGPGGCAGG